jgi:sensor domain CHASE-containing protein
MIAYDIYLLELVFHTVAVVGRLVLKLQRDSTKEETIHKNIKKQNTNTEYTIQKTKMQNKSKHKRI